MIPFALLFVKRQTSSYALCSYKQAITFLNTGREVVEELPTKSNARMTAHSFLISFPSRSDERALKYSLRTLLQLNNFSIS